MGDRAAATGSVSLPQLKSLIKDGLIETVVLAQLDHTGTLFGKRIEARAFAANAEAGIRTSSAAYGRDLSQTFVDGLGLVGWHTGYGDTWGRPDWSTARVLPWLTRTAIVLCDTLSEDGEELPFAPRSILRRQVERLESLGFGCQVASELEFHVYCDTPAEARTAGFQNLHASSPFHQDYSILHQSTDELFLSAVRRHLTDADIPVECSKGEYGWGQSEVNLLHSEAIEAADRHVLYKSAVKEIARQRDRLVTFMALPDAAEQPCSGSSCHIHLSLWDNDGADREISRNAFADDNKGETLSALTRHFLGGVMHGALDLMPLYAPYINSYKRLLAERFSPCTNAWGCDNRSVAWRVVGDGPASRIENRIPGADVNPYLAYAAMIGSGIHGIEHKLEPGCFAVGNAREMPEAPPLPRNLPQAVERFASSELAAEILTPEVVRHLTRLYDFEVQQYFTVVTDWERRTYFEGV